MNKAYLKKTRISTLCIGLSLAAFHTAQADTWSGGDGKFEDPTAWGLGTVPASSAQQSFQVNDDGSHCLADSETWAYLSANGLLNSSTVYRGINRILMGQTQSGTQTVSFTLDIGDANTFQLTSQATQIIGARQNTTTTVNIKSGAIETGKITTLGNNATNCTATLNISGGEFRVGRDQFVMGGNTATALVSMSGGTFKTRTGIEINANATFEVKGSAPVEIGIGSHASGDGYAIIDGTLKPMIDAGGLTPIFIDDQGGGASATLGVDSEIDVSFLGAPQPGTWTVLEVEGAAIVDNGIGFATGVDTNIWSFQVDNTGANGLLTVTATGISDLLWAGKLSDDTVNNTWDIGTTENWQVNDGSTFPFTSYSEPTVATFDNFSTSTTVNMTDTFENVNLIVDSTVDFTFTGTGGISGNAALSKNDSSALTLENSGTNNFDGGIFVNGGSIVLNGNTTTTSGLSVASGTTLEISNGSNLSVDSTSGNTFAGRLMGDGSLTIDGAGQTHTFSDVLSEYTGSIVIAAGTLQSNGAGGSNAIGGNTRGDSGLPAPALGGPIQIGDSSNQDATLFINGYSSLKDNQDITVVGSGDHLLTASNNNTGQVTFAQDITLTNADLKIQHTGRSGYRLVGPMTGTGNLVFLGNTADTRASNTLDVRAQINNVGTITNSGTGNNSLNINGGQSGSIGANVTGIVQNNVSANPGVLVSDFIINSNNASFVGTVDVLAGTMRLSNAGALNAANTVTIEAGAVLDVQNNVTIGELVDGAGGPGTITNNGTANYTLNVGGTGNSTFSGLLEDGTTNLLGINQGGTGSLTLTGVNTYVGPTSVNQGTLVMGNLEAFGASATLAPLADIEITTVTGSADVTVAPGTKITVGSHITSASIPADTVVGAYNSATGVVTLSAAATADATEIATFNGIGALLTDTSPDITVAPGTPIYAGMYVSANGIPAGTRVDSYNSGTGIVTLNANATSTSAEVVTFTGAIAVNTNGTLDLNGLTIADNFSSINGTIINSNTSTPAVISNEIVGLGFPTFDGPGDITVDNIRMTSGVTRRITKNGTGALTLGGDLANNRYSLTVNEGDVFLDKPDGVDAVSRFPLVINNVASTVTLLAGNQILNNADINGLHEINAGTLDLNGFDEGIAYLSTTNGTETDGIVTNSDVVTTSTLTLLGGGFDATYPGAITGNLNLVKNGANVQTLSGTNTYTGTTSVNAGSLVINGANSSTSLTSVASAAAIGGSGSLGGDLTIAAGGLFIFSESATLSVTGAVSVDSTFGIDDLVGISSTTPDGTYTLIDGTSTVFSGIENLGSANAFDLGDGKSAYFQNGSLQVVVESVASEDDFSSWATDNGIDGELPGDDFESDGLSNLIEYALGKDPTVFDGPAETSYDGITVVYTKGAEAIANGDVRWAIEESDDLGLTDPWAEVVIQEAGDMSATISYTLPSVTKVFVRLKVTEAP